MRSMNLNLVTGLLVYVAFVVTLLLFGVVID